tara:strand:+ start:13306 stop:13671 length:366 start_codon:yes stop_codon:yes gene_type:complete
LIILSVAIGGAIGSLLRYYISTISFLSNSIFPFSTFLVNISGSFIIGVLFFLLKDTNNDLLKSFLTVGFLGGFTTFSAFSGDVLELFHNDQHLISIIYICGSVTISLLAVYLGFWITKITN